MISLRCASSWAWAALIASGETAVVMAEFTICELRWLGRQSSRLDVHLRDFVFRRLVWVGKCVEIALVQHVHHTVGNYRGSVDRVAHVDFVEHFLFLARRQDRE